MKVAIGSDHGAFDLKQDMIPWLKEKGIEVVDKGCDSHDSCDYPIYAKAVAEAVANGSVDKGIVLCTTGIGASIASASPGVIFTKPWGLSISDASFARNLFGARPTDALSFSSS